MVCCIFLSDGAQEGLLQAVLLLNQHAQGRIQPAQQAEKLRLKEEEAERQRKQKLEDEARRKAERRAAKIESQLISAGGQVLKRGLLGVLKKW